MVRRWSPSTVELHRLGHHHESSKRRDQRLRPSDARRRKYAVQQPALSSEAAGDSAPCHCSRSVHCACLPRPIRCWRTSRPARIPWVASCKVPTVNCHATTDGGPSGVFEMTRGGKVTILDGLPGGSMAGLLLATDGNFYGTTVRGGAHREGSVFRVTPEGALTTIYSFFLVRRRGRSAATAQPLPHP